MTSAGEPNGQGVKLRRLIAGARRVRREHATVSLNDRLAGAAPDTGRAINSLPVGAARSAALTISVQRTQAALARIAVRWNGAVRQRGLQVVFQN